MFLALPLLLSELVAGWESSLPDLVGLDFHAAVSAGSPAFSGAVPVPLMNQIIRLGDLAEILYNKPEVLDQFLGAHQLRDADEDVA